MAPSAAAAATGIEERATGTVCGLVPVGELAGDDVRRIVTLCAGELRQVAVCSVGSVGSISTISTGGAGNTCGTCGANLARGASGTNRSLFAFAAEPIIVKAARTRRPISNALILDFSMESPPLCGVTPVQWSVDRLRRRVPSGRRVRSSWVIGS